MTPDFGKRFVSHWAVRLLFAAALPAWVLFIAATEHGSPSLSAVTTPVLAAIVLIGALIGGGLGVWGMLRPDQAKARMQAWAEPEPPMTALQRLLNLIAVAAFLASGYQALFRFDVFSVQLEQAGVFAPGVVTPWNTLLALCALQFILFATEAVLGVTRRGTASSL